MCLSQDFASCRLRLPEKLCACSQAQWNLEGTSLQASILSLTLVKPSRYVFQKAAVLLLSKLFIQKHPTFAQQNGVTLFGL